MSHKDAARRPILHVVTGARGGICRHVVEMSERLLRDGWSASITGPTLTIRRMRELGLPVEIPTVETRPAWRGSLAWLTHPVEGPPGAIHHAHGYKAGILGVLHRAPRLIITAHNLPPQRGSRYAVTALRRARAVVAVSEAVAVSLLALGARPESLWLIPNGIPIPPLPGEEVRSRARQRLLQRVNLAEGPASPGAILLGVGRLSPEKGFDLLIQAMPAVLRSRPDAILILVGEGPEKPRLQRLAAGLQDRVFFAGAVLDARPLLPGCDLVVIPSRSEGLPFVALEALAAGLRVVAADVGGIPSVIRPGQTGWLAPPEDPEALAGIILQALGMPADSHQRAGRELLQREFDAERSFAKLRSLYLSLSGNPPGSKPESLS